MSRPEDNGQPFVRTYEYWFQLVGYRAEDGSRIQHTHVLLLSKLDSLSDNELQNRKTKKFEKKEGTCVSDDFLAGCFNVARITIQHWLQTLEKAKLIIRDYDQSREAEGLPGRIIKLNYKLIDELCPKQDPSNYKEKERTRRENLKNKKADHIPTQEHAMYQPENMTMYQGRNMHVPTQEYGMYQGRYPIKEDIKDDKKDSSIKKLKKEHYSSVVYNLAEMSDEEFADYAEHILEQDAYYDSSEQN